MSPKPTIFNLFITLVRYPALHPYLHLHLIANVGSDGGGALVSTAAPVVGGVEAVRTSDKAITWEDFDGVPMASLLAKFRMPEIERYTRIGCPRIHLRLYSTIMRAHGLDGAQMIMFFPMSWVALHNVGLLLWMRELEALRQRTDESVSSFISRWHGKIVEIIDKPLERDRVQMVLRSLQPRVARHVVGGTRSQILAHWFWLYTMSRTASREDYEQILLLVILREEALCRIEVSGCERHWFFQSEASQAPSADPTAFQALFFLYISSVQATGTSAQQTSAPFALRTHRQFSQLGMPLSQALRKLTEVELLTALAPRPPPQPIPP
ncbi:hypothetical protein CK203_058695 [Vitis vinifera]|uniref:Uncharacterized protein n=1 Tax=Vitis vinifera TaxID=29760 RepID=A0A438GEV5_VITVI|nr:hypothetical protein CK203_058695 [Vitis vinifera]